MPFVWACRLFNGQKTSLCNYNTRIADRNSVIIEYSKWISCLRKRNSRWTERILYIIFYFNHRSSNCSNTIYTYYSIWSSYTLTDPQMGINFLDQAGSAWLRFHGLLRSLFRELTNTRHAAEEDGFGRFRAGLHRCYEWIVQLQFFIVTRPARYW